MPISLKKTTLCKYCGKEIKFARNDVLSLKDVKVLLDSCCMKCKIKKFLQFKKNI